MWWHRWQAVEAQLTEMKAELEDARALRREVDGVGDFSLILEADRAVTELEVSCNLACFTPSLLAASASRIVHN